MLSQLKTTHAHNISTLRSQPLLELSGAFGDLGTFLPIFIALSAAGQISAPATLIFSGLANIITGALFGIPLPVQPMKAIAAVAIAKDLSNAEIAGAGFLVAGVVGLLSLTGLLDWFIRAVPVPIVKGIQVGAGLSLMISAFTKNLPLHPESTQAYGIQVGLLVGTLLLLLLHALRPRTPFVLVIIVLSIAACLVGLITNATASSPSDHLPTFSIYRPSTVVPTPSEFATGALTAGLGQIPLTTLNSVLAVVVLAQDLFPSLHTSNRLPSAGTVGASVAAMNLLALWFRSMPFCHGSGGLAAQYRFGSRSGASVILLGAIKLVLGLFAAEFVLAWCRAFAGQGNAVLGVLVFLAGLELAKMGESVNGPGARDLWGIDSSTSSGGHAANLRVSGEIRGEEEAIEDVGAGGESERKTFRGADSEARMRRWVVMLVTVGALLGAKNDGVGFVAGMGVHAAYVFVDWVARRREGDLRLS